MVSRRQERVSEMLLEELSILVAAELTDPRLADAMVSVTDVQLSQDLRNARIYIEHVLPSEQSRQVLEALRHSSSFLRRTIAEHLNLRVVPDLTFHIDSSGERARHVEQLLDDLSTQRKPSPGLGAAEVGSDA